MFEVMILTATSDLGEEEFDILLPLVSVEKQGRIRKFHLFQDAKNCLLGDILARSEICRFTELENKQLEFSVNEYGKPFLINNPDIHFNISHASNYVACVIADKPVGIDIELIKATESIELRIAKRFFTEDEIKYIFTDEHVLRFYEVWTKKESRIKMEGKGLHIPLSSFSVFETADNISYYKIYQDRNAICHVCFDKEKAPNIRITDVTSFVQRIIRDCGMSAVKTYYTK